MAQSLVTDFRDTCIDFYSTSLGAVYTIMVVNQAAKVSEYFKLNNALTQCGDLFAKTLTGMGLPKMISGGLSLWDSVEGASSKGSSQEKGYNYWSIKNLSVEAEFLSDVASTVGLFAPGLNGITTIAGKACSFTYQSLKAFMSYEVLDNYSIENKGIWEKSSRAELAINRALSKKVEKTLPYAAKFEIDPESTEGVNLRIAHMIESSLRVVKNVAGAISSAFALIACFSDKVRLSNRAKLVLGTISVSCGILSSLACSYGNVQIKRVADGVVA